MKRHFKSTVLILGIVFCLLPVTAFATSVQYTLYVDDYAQLYIDGTLRGTYDVNDNGVLSSPILNLSDGWHDIGIIYKNRQGSNNLQLLQGGTIVSLDSLRSLDSNGNYIEGLKADYYDLSGGFVKTIYGEGPIQNGWVWAGTPGSSVIVPMYEGVSPSLWAGIYNGWSIFEERLSGGIYVGQQPVPEPVTMLLLSIGLAGLAGATRKLKK